MQEMSAVSVSSVMLDSDYRLSAADEKSREFLL